MLYDCMTCFFANLPQTLSNREWPSTNQILFISRAAPPVRKTEDSTTGGFSLPTVQAKFHQLQLGVFLVATP